MQPVKSKLRHIYVIEKIMSLEFYFHTVEVEGSSPPSPTIPYLPRDEVFTTKVFFGRTHLFCLRL